MVPDRNVKVAHAQDVVLNNELLLLTLKEFTNCSFSFHANRNARSFIFLIVIAQSVSLTNGISVVSL
jgi:hypothetical protein